MVGLDRTLNRKTKIHRQAVYELHIQTRTVDLTY